jgi:periplasmic protein CpxP/Spy
MNQVVKIARGCVFAGWLWGWVLCAPLTAAPAHAATDDGAVAVPQRAARPGGAGGLEERIQLFSKALDLSAAQQTQLRKILLEQRQSVRKIWSEPTLPATDRVAATRALNERTADNIRAILNDEQKKKYSPAPASTPREPGDQRSVGQWLDATRPR